MPIRIGQLKKRGPGDVVSARDFNAIIDAIMDLAAVERGGAVVDHIVEARVTRVYGNIIEDRLDRIFYDVESRGTDIRLTRVAPDYGRPFDEPDIMLKPARMGARCFLYRFIGDDGEETFALHLPFGGKGERLAISRCGQNAARFPSLRRMMDSGGGALGPPAPPGGGGPDVGGGGPVT